MSTVASLWLTSVAGEGTERRGGGEGKEEEREGTEEEGEGAGEEGEGTGGRGEGQTKTRVIVKNDNVCISHT